VGRCGYGAAAEGARGPGAGGRELKGRWDQCGPTS
jgi:hypothetical protein